MAAAVKTQGPFGNLGGHQIIVERDAALPVGAYGRLRLYRKTQVDPTIEYALVAEVLNGRPGERETDQIGGTVYLLTPFPADATHPKARCFLRGYLPRLATGVYWLVLEVKVGSNWVMDALVSPAIRVVNENRHGEVYGVRELFPSPPHDPGPATSGADPVVGVGEE